MAICREYRAASHDFQQPCPQYYLLAQRPTLCRRHTKHPPSDPNRPVCPALSTAGLAQAFPEMAGPDYRKAAFQNQSRARPG